MIEVRGELALVMTTVGPAVCVHCTEEAVKLPVTLPLSIIISLEQKALSTLALTEQSWALSEVESPTTINMTVHKKIKNFLLSTEVNGAKPWQRNLIGFNMTDTDRLISHHQS